MSFPSHLIMDFKFKQESTQPKLLEIFTPSTQNDLVLKEYINSLK